MNISNLVKRMDLRGAKATLAALPWMPRAILPHPEPRALSPARPTPFLRASRFALLALALCGALLLMATPASAQQTVVTLISNTGQTDDSTIGLTAGFPGDAMAFTTGSNASGYTLDSIGIDFTSITHTSVAADDLTATLNADDSGSPGDALCTLTDPATFTASGVQTFDAPSSGTTCPTLAASTTYFAVVTLASDATGAYNFEITTSTSEDSGAATGWSIADKSYYLSGTTWTLFNGGALLIEVKGFNAVATPGVTISESTLAVTEGGSTGTYTVVLDTAPTGDVTIAVTETSDDISLSATTLTFGTANWSAAQAVTVTAVDDSSTEAEETVTITHSVSASADTTDYPTTLAVDSVSVTVTDNDAATPGVTVSESTVSVTEGGATDTYTVVLDTAPTGDVVIAVTETSADISVNPTTLTFGTANWSTAQIVTVTAVDDSTTEAEETVTITHSVSASADTTDYPTTLTVDSVSVTVTDNDDATPPGAPVLTAAAKNESIELTWTIADHGTSDITRFDYRIKQTTGGTYPATWTDTGAAALNTGGSATIGSLTNGTQYTVQVRGVSSDGEGAGSNEPTATPDAPPAITSVAITSDPGTDKTYIIDEEIEFTLTFDKDLTLGGTNPNHLSKPYIIYRMESHSNDPQVDDPEANCVIGTDTKTAVCTDNVDEGNYDTDGIHVPTGQLNYANPSVRGFYGPLGQLVLGVHPAIAVDANHKVDGVKPTLTTTGVSSDGTRIILTFSEDIGTVDRTKITVKSGTTTKAITSTSWTFSSVNLFLTTALTAADTAVTVELDADAVTDVPGNGIDAVSPMAVSLVDTTAPTFVSAGTSDTDKVVLTYDEALNTTQPATSAFTVKVGGNNRGVNTVAISGSAVTLTLASAFRPGDTLTVAYSKPGTNPIKDAADNEAVSLAETTVTNNLAATAPEAPDGLASSDIPVPGQANVYVDQLELFWVTPWHNGSDITKFQYRYAEGTSVPGTTGWTDIPDSAPTEQNSNGYVVEGLDPGTQYTFEVRAVNGIGGGGETASMPRTTRTPNWSFTLRDSSNTNVTELTEGGDAATATVSITNNVRFSTAQTITLEWGNFSLEHGRIQGAGNTSAFTILAGASTGHLDLSVPDNEVNPVYFSDEAHDLTATWEGDVIGTIMDLRSIDDESPPVARITDAPESVNEGDTIDIDIELSVRYSGPGALRFTITDSDSALSGTLPDRVVLAGSELTATVTLTAVENTTQDDGARNVTFTLETSTEIPYTLGTPKTVTIIVRDNDTPPTAPRNLTAQAGNTTARLSWQAPAPPVPDHGQPITHYEYQVKVGSGSFSSWATIPDSDANTTSHTFTGLTNNTPHTFEVRAVNIAGGGAEASTTVTPIVGVGVSFVVAALSVDEGAGVAVTVTLGAAPAATVTVPLQATRGVGLEASEYSGVPASVIFNAGETSKSFTVTTVEDTADEPNAVLTLAFGPLPAGYIVGTHAELALTVVDDDHPIVSATFDRATATVSEGGTVAVTVNLSQAPEREVVLPLVATRGANFAADEVAGVPASVTIAADATQAGFTVTFADDAEEEGNETLTLTFGPRPAGVTSGANPQLVLTVTDDDGPPAAPDVSAQTGDGYVTLSWDPVANDSPILRYEVRVDGGAWQSVGLETSYRYEDLENGRAYVFEVRAVNAHGNGDEASAPGTPTARLTGIPNAVQVLQVKATDSGRAELSWTRPANGTDRVTANSATATFSQIQGYRIEVCRTPCGDEANWYALVANTGRFAHSYVHQVLAPGVIRENHYRVQAININGKTGPWSNVATLDRTVVENFRLQTPDDSTLWVRFRVLNPDGNKLYVRYTNTGTGSMGNAEPYRLTKKGDVKLDLTGLEADSWYRVDIDFSADFDSARRQSRWYGTAKAGHTPLTSPYAVDALDAQVFAGGAWRDASDTALYVRMGGTGKYRVRLKPCQGIHDVIVHRIQAPAGRLRASPMETDPVLFTNLNCESEFDDWRRDEHGVPLTMDQVYDMTNFPDRAKDLIPIYAGTPNNWHEVTVTARALEDYPHDVRADALLSAPFAVVYNHEVWKEVNTSSSYLVSEGTGLVRVLVDRPADAVLPVPGGVTIGSDRVMTWDAVSGATGYLVEWRHGPQYSDRANQNRSLQTATSVTLPPGASGRGPVTARVRAYSSSGVSAWSPERTWDSRAPTLNVLDTAVNEADGSVGFLVTLDPAATGIVTVQYTTVDATAVAPADYTATSGTLTFAPGDTRKQTALVPIVNDGEEDSGETFRLVLSNPTGSDANNGAAVLGDAEAVATILNSEREAAELTGFTLVDAGTNGDLMALADGSTVELGELLASSYGIRAEMSAGAPPGSVRLALTGAKTVTRTDDAAPWSLYGDGAGRVNGGSLPPGSYTLTATAYADSGGRGDERGSLEVSFTVAAGALGVTTPGPFTVAEGKTAVAQLAASDTGTGGEAVWSIPAGAAGGADGAAFAVTSEGVLSLVAAKDFEAPDDADGDGTYEVSVSVTAGTQTATAALSVTLADVDEPTLAVTTAGPFTVAEGETAVAALAASDTGTGATAVWSIPAGAESGADGAAFAVTSEGVLSLVAAKDFEAPDDADGDGTYEVSVAVAVPASSMAGAQSATAALLVTLSDVNEAPVAQASASAARVREGARVTLDGSASTDPDAGDTLTYLWTQADDGAPRVTLSDASAEQPAFTSPSDLAAETELAFTLRVTDADGLYAEDTLSVAVTLISEVSISAASNYAAEGDEAVFRLTRAGSALRALTVPVTVEETGAMLGTGVPAGATFAAGVREAELRVPTLADAVLENDSQVTVRLGSGPGWQLAPGAASASLTVLDDDVAPSVSVADVTIWSADMTVVEYGPRSIGAGTADLFSNQMGRAGLRAKWLWYDPVTRKLKLGFDDSLDDAELLTLHMGGVSLGFPDGTGGNSSFSLENVDLDWTDGETLAVRVSKPSAETVSTDATLASLTVDGATLSPAFDAGVLVYRAAGAGAGTVTVAATASDAGAAVAYGPGEDADTALADHQVAVPDEGEALVEVTVTAADGTVRRYRVVVAPTAAESNTAPTGAPTISGTPQVGETLTADTSAINDEDGLDDVSYSYQWIRSDGNNDTDIPDATDTTYTLTVDDVGKTIQVRVTFTDDANNQESRTSEATVAVAAAEPNSEPTGLPAVNGTPQVGQTLTADTSAIDDPDGLENVSYRYQWISSKTVIDDVTGTSNILTSDVPGATNSTYTLAPADEGFTFQVKVSFTDDADYVESLTSEATVAVAPPPNTEPTGLPAVTGTPQVGETLAADTSSIDDADGLANVSYSYQWIRNDGNSDSDIPGATDTTYTLDANDVGKTIKVKVTFTDDADNDETLTSEATVAATATVPSAPQSMTVTSGSQTQELDVSWQAPSSNGGSAVTGYKVQWKESTDSWDTADDVSEATETGTTHTITSLTGGVEYAVRVIATNVAGDSPASTEARATPADSPASGEEGTETGESDSTAAWTASLTVGVSGSGSEAVWGYSWFLDGMGTLDKRTYNEGDQTIEVMAILMSNGFVAFNVRPHPSVDFVLTVDGTEFASADASEVKSQMLISYVWATTLDWAEDDRVALSLTLKDTDSAEQSEPEENTPAIGLPTISGTPQVDETLTADTSAISDEDGLSNVSYQYQWLRDDADIAGQTISTYRLVSADQDKTIKVRVTFRDDADNAEFLTSMATTAVAAQPTPAVLLTASFANVPADHNGDNFTFQLNFSENVNAGYARIRDHAFTVDGATIANAYRQTQGSNQGWHVEVDPTGNGEVSITLPETTDCDDSGAICADDERMLSHATSVRVTGPPAISVSDATVQEAEGAVLVFTATLSHASSRTVTVDYATSDGTAVAGSDYTAASGALTFNAGDTSQTVQVTVLTDSEDESQETLTLTLSNPSQATLDDATGAGAIENGESSSGTQEDPPAEDPPVVLLTASLDNMPATHNGTAFTFDLTFSEEFGLSYVTLKTHAFNVTGGTVENAQRTDKPSNISWRITVKPNGNGDVTVVLPVTTDCNAEGAICTADGRKLSNLLEFTVSGPGQ